MKKRYRLVRRGERNTFYCFDTLTKKRTSLETGNPEEADRLIAAKNEACLQPVMNLQIARVYLHHTDPAYSFCSASAGSSVDARHHNLCGLSDQGRFTYLATACPREQTCSFS